MKSGSATSLTDLFISEKFLFDEKIPATAVLISFIFLLVIALMHRATEMVE